MTGAPAPAGRDRGRDRGPDRGRVSVFVAAAMPAMLLFMGLMWDASGYLRALHRADNIAAEAARAAGQAIDLPLAVAGERIVVDPEAAAGAAAGYLADAGASGTVEVSADRRTVTVTVALTYHPVFLGAFGFGPYLVDGVGEAHLVDG
jgi:hypothetical protein